jgi:hypothetical protein
VAQELAADPTLTGLARGEVAMLLEKLRNATDAATGRAKINALFVLQKATF